MRAIHLLGLRGVGGARLRFFPEDDAALVLPWWIPERDREVLLAFYQQVIADDLLVRVEVEWTDGIAPQDLAFLASERRRHGAEDRMVVVRVRREGVDLHDVLGLPEVRAFRRVAVVCEHMAEHETLGVLLGLGSVATLAAEERYDQLAEELSLRTDARELLAPVLQRLQNPIDMVECFNALIEAQRVDVGAAFLRDRVIERSVRRLLRDLTFYDVGYLVALASPPGTFHESVLSNGSSGPLRSRMLVRDRHLTGWAAWLAEPPFFALLLSRMEALALEAEKGAYFGATTRMWRQIVNAGLSDLPPAGAPDSPPPLKPPP